MSARIGWFFIIVGCVLLIIFFASDMVKETAYQYLCLGMAGVVVGLIMWNRGKPETPHSGRFRSLHRTRGPQNEPKRPRDKENPPP